MDDQVFVHTCISSGEYLDEMIARWLQEIHKVIFTMFEIYIKFKFVGKSWWKKS
jgi:hypothetical protein